MHAPDQHIIFIVSAPSGAGKTTLVRALLEQVKGLSTTVSHTTRAKRPAEVEGKHYYFVEHHHYHALREQSEFLEYADVFGHHYATSKQELKRLLVGGDVILDIDWQGALQIRELFGARVVSIFILPPSLAVLQQRLEARAQDDDAVIGKRMAAARAEISHYHDFDYLVVNDHFADALQSLVAIIQAERLTMERQAKAQTALISELLIGG